MDKTEKTLNLQHYLHHPQHFYPLKSCDAPCILLVSERYTGNVAKFNAFSENPIKSLKTHQIKKIKKIKTQHHSS